MPRLSHHADPAAMSCYAAAHHIDPPHPTPAYKWMLRTIQAGQATGWGRMERNGGAWVTDVEKARQAWRLERGYAEDAPPPAAPVLRAAQSHVQTGAIRYELRLEYEGQRPRVIRRGGIDFWMRGSHRSALQAEAERQLRRYRHAVYAAVVRVESDGYEITVWMRTRKEVLIDKPLARPAVRRFWDYLTGAKIDD